MFKILLDHGADPCARYERTTVIHRMIETIGCGPCQNTLLKDILSQPNVDLEICNSEVSTPFLVSCSRKAPWEDRNFAEPSLIQMFLNSGCDTRARDDSSRNALHILFDASFDGRFDRHQGLRSSGPGTHDC